MQHHTVIWLMAFCLTALSARFWPFLPGKPCIVLLACIVITIYLFQIWLKVSTKRKLHRKLRGVTFLYAQNQEQITTVTCLLGGIMTGMIWMASVGHWYLAWQLPTSKIQQDVIVTGQITKTATKQDGQLVYLSTATLDDRTFWFSPTLALHVSLNVGTFSIHQQVRWMVSVKPAGSILNPGVDRRSKLVSDRVIATGHVKSSALNELITPASSLHYRTKMRLRSLGYSRWLIALLTGSREYLTGADWLLLQRTGTGHLFSISGLHVGMVAMWAVGLSVLLLTAVVLLTTQHNAVNLRGLIVLSVVVLTAAYCSLADWQVPVSRAWLLVCLCSVLAGCRLYWSWFQRYVLMIALCIIVFPFSVFSDSFYLSAGAVGLLLFLGWRLKKPAPTFFSKVWFAVKLQMAMSILMVPMTLVFFHSASLFTAAINFVAIPLVTLFVPIGLVGIVFNAFTEEKHFLLDATDTGLQWLISCLTASEDYMVYLGDTHIATSAACLFFFTLVLLFMPPFRYRKRCSVLCCVPIMSSAIPANPAVWMLHVFDVGQGTAIAISRGQHATLIDTGPSFTEGDAFSAWVMPALHHVGIKQVDMVVVSHGDDDHAGGLNGYYRASQDSTLRLLNHVVTNTSRCQRGYHWQWQGLSFEVLWPKDNAGIDDNAHSCVIRVSDGTHSILFPGDIDKSTEYALLYGYDTLNSDILIAPHHGSDTSSSNAFLTAVSPQLAIFTTGFLHRWRLPEQTVISRYRHQGVDLFTTGNNGYIRIEFDGKTKRIYRYNREVAPRWYDIRYYFGDHSASTKY